MNKFGTTILWSTLIFSILSLISIMTYCFYGFHNDIYKGDIYLTTEIEHNKDCVLADAIDDDDGLKIVNQIGKEDLSNAMQSGLLQ